MSSTDPPSLHLSALVLIGLLLQHALPDLDEADGAKSVAVAVAAAAAASWLQFHGLQLLLLLLLLLLPLWARVDHQDHDPKCPKT